MAKVVRFAALASLPALLLASLAMPAQAGAPEGMGVLERLALPERPEPVSVMLELDAVPAAVAWAEAPTTRSKSASARAAIARVETLAAGVRRAVGKQDVL